MKAARESDVLAACLQYLRWKGIYCWRQNQGAIPLRNGSFRRFVGLKGVSDILGILPQTAVLDGREVTFGVFLAVEVKQPGERPRPEQAEFLRRVEELGGVAIVAHGVDELERELDQASAGSLVPRRGDG